MVEFLNRSTKLLCELKFPGLLILMVVLGWIAPSDSAAQTASFRSVDTNGDRVLDFEELVEAFGTVDAQRILSTTDRDGDRRITLYELRSGGNDDRPSGESRIDNDSNNQHDDDGDGDD